MASAERHENRLPLFMVFLPPQMPSLSCLFLFSFVAFFFPSLLSFLLPKLVNPRCKTRLTYTLCSTFELLRPTRLVELDATLPSSPAAHRIKSKLQAEWNLVFPWTLCSDPSSCGPHLPPCFPANIGFIDVLHILPTCQTYVLGSLHLLFSLPRRDIGVSVQCYLFKYLWHGRLPICGPMPNRAKEVFVELIWKCAMISETHCQDKKR